MIWLLKGVKQSFVLTSHAATIYFIALDRFSFALPFTSLERGSQWGQQLSPVRCGLMWVVLNAYVWMWECVCCPLGKQMAASVSGWEPHTLHISLQLSSLPVFPICRAAPEWRAQTHVVPKIPAIHILSCRLLLSDALCFYSLVINGTNSLWLFWFCDFSNNEEFNMVSESYSYCPLRSHYICSLLLSVSPL